MSLFQAILEAIWDVIVGLSNRATARLLPATAPRWMRFLSSLLIALLIFIASAAILILGATRLLG